MLSAAAAIVLVVGLLGAPRLLHILPRMARPSTVGRSFVAGAGQVVERPFATLSLLSSRAVRSESRELWIVEGEVRNLTAQPLTNVQAVATWLDDRGATLQSDSAPLELKRLMPGEVSVFRTATVARRGMSRFDVQFRSETGQPLLLQDESRAGDASAIRIQTITEPQVATDDGCGATTTPANAPCGRPASTAPPVQQ